MIDILLISAPFLLVGGFIGWWITSMGDRFTDELLTDLKAAQSEAHALRRKLAKAEEDIDTLNKWPSALRMAAALRDAKGRWDII